ncbi:MAG TPA: enoyl-CoA hydratase/isomerase family protein [Kofleriaceae bacterium]
MIGVITRRTHGPVVELCLDRRPANALGRAACEQWTAALRDAVTAGADAIVLSGPSGVFSSGADLPELARADRSGVAAFCRALGGLVTEVAHCPVPIAAALTGHCLGAASGVALLCDARFMATGHHRFRINYVAMGLVPPLYVRRAVERLVGPGQAARLLVGALAVAPDEARALGLVERTAAPGEVVGAALDWCRQQLALPRTAMLETRKRLREELVACVTPENLGIDEMTDRWFGAEVQVRLAKLVTAQDGRVIANGE